MIVLKLQTHFPMRVTDWLLAGILISWGVACLAVSDTTWQLGIYDGLRRIARKETWGEVAFALGLFRMIALFVNGAVRRTPHVRALGAFLSAFIWIQLSFAVFESSIPTISVGIYPWLFIGELYNVFRASRDARMSDHRAKEANSRGVGNAASAEP